MNATQLTARRYLRITIAAVCGVVIVVLTVTEFVQIHASSP